MSNHQERKGHHSRVDGHPTMDYTCPYEGCGHQGPHKVSDKSGQKNIRICAGCNGLFEVTLCLEMVIPYEETASTVISA